MASTVIDLSRLPAPDAIEPLSSALLKTAYVDRFKAAWAIARAADPTLPDYDVEVLETDPAIIIGEAFSYLRLLDRARVNDAVRAVLAPLARGGDLDNVAARANVERLELSPAVGLTPAVMESDASLLRRYLLSFDRPSAGSADRFLYEAYTAVPTLQDAVVHGRVVHGVRGEVQVVIAGPGGAVATTGQVAAVMAAVSASDVKPEATGVTVLAAAQSAYTVSIKIAVPRGPDPSVVESEVRAAILAAANARMIINTEVQAEAAVAPAYLVPNVLRVDRLSPLADIAADPYRFPVCSGVHIDLEVVG